MCRLDPLGVSTMTYVGFPFFVLSLDLGFQSSSRREVLVLDGTMPRSSGWQGRGLASSDGRPTALMIEKTCFVVLHHEIKF